MANELTIRPRDEGWLASLKHRVEDVFHRLNPWAETTAPTATQPGDLTFWRRYPLGPAVDVINGDDDVRVVAELPGLSPEDFKVQVEGRRVYLSGRRGGSREERRDGYVYRECSFGSFSRVVPLPCEVATDKATASFEQGLLQLTLPKTEAAKAKVVKVRVD